MSNELGNTPADKDYKPSGISKAEERAMDSWAMYDYREHPKGLYHTCYVDGFKAGAKWAMEQGVITDVSIDEFSCGLYNLCVQCGLTSEDDVIVQIRKKDE